MSLHGRDSSRSKPEAHLDVALPSKLDLTKGYVPLLLAIALAVFSFSIGSIWNSSAKDLQALQDDVRDLAQGFKELQEAVNKKDDNNITRKDLALFCFQLAQQNKSLKCPSSL